MDVLMMMMMMKGHCNDAGCGVMHCSICQEVGI